MTRKDYEKFASMFKSYTDLQGVPSSFDDGYDRAVVLLANDVAQIFAEDNPRFDKARFLKACGME